MEDKDEYHRGRLRRMAEASFAINAERRAARRKRWREQSVLAAELARDYLSGDSIRTLVGKHGLAYSRVRALIEPIVTEADLRERRRMLHCRRQRNVDRLRRAANGLESNRKPVLGYPSIAACARANGLRPGTLEMRLRNGVMVSAQYLK